MFSSAVLHICERREIFILWMSGFFTNRPYPKQSEDFRGSSEEAPNISEHLCMNAEKTTGYNSKLRPRRIRSPLFRYSLSFFLPSPPFWRLPRRLAGCAICERRATARSWQVKKRIIFASPFVSLFATLRGFIAYRERKIEPLAPNNLF